jgi:hypothetical protein
MKKTPEQIREKILRISEHLHAVAFAVCAGIFVLAATQAAFWIRDDIYINARMDTPEYIAKLRAGCSKANGCAGAKVAVEHFWAADSATFFKLGAHMRVELQSLPQDVERAALAVIGTIPESDRQFIQVISAGIKKTAAN